MGEIYIGDGTICRPEIDVSTYGGTANAVDVGTMTSKDALKCGIASVYGWSICIDVEVVGEILLAGLNDLIVTAEGRMELERLDRDTTADIIRVALSRFVDFTDNVVKIESFDVCALIYCATDCVEAEVGVVD